MTTAKSSKALTQSSPRLKTTKARSIYLEEKSDPVAACGGFLLFRLFAVLAVVSFLAAFSLAQSNGKDAPTAGVHQSPEAIAAMLQKAEKTGESLDATIELRDPLFAVALENITVPGEIRSILIKSTTSDWRGGIFSTTKSPLTSLAKGLRSYEQLYREAEPGNPDASFAVTAFTLRSSASDIFRASNSIAGASIVSVVESSQMQEIDGEKSTPAQELSSPASPEQSTSISSGIGAFAPNNAELNIQTLSNSDRRIEVTFSWNSPADMSGMSDSKSALEIQVLFRNQADDADNRNVSYVGGDKPKAYGANFNNYYFDTPAYNNQGIAGSKYEHEVTIGSYKAHSDFQAGPTYKTWAVMEKGQLDANFAKLSFQLGIYQPNILENLPGYLYCQKHGGTDPASCVAGVDGGTYIMTPKNYTGTTFSILAPTTPLFNFPSQTCSIVPGYPEGINFNTLTEGMAKDLVPQILPFQQAYNRNGGSTAVGCPIDGHSGFVHKDTVWWPQGGLTQDVDGTRNGKGIGAIMLAPGAPNAFWVHGAIWDRYKALGGPKSVVGEPDGDEQSVTSSRGNKGAYQKFKTGYLYFNTALNQTFYVANAIADKYRSVGLQDDTLGLPISNEHDCKEGRCSDFEGGYIYWNSSQGAVVVRFPFYQGYHDTVDSNKIAGWVRDRGNPNTRLNVSVIDEATGATVASGIANEFRQDLVNAGIGDGKYGFTIATPASLKDGKTHSLLVKVTGTDFKLSGTPKTLNLTYQGYHDYVDCNNIGGWVRDRENPNARLSVSVIDDKTGATVASGTANEFRQDLVSAGIGDGKYGFTIPIPPGLKDGQNHTLRVKVTGTDFSLGNTPKTFNSGAACAATTPTPTPTPGTPNYVGYFDWANCDSIDGWAADRNRLGTPISVSIYDGDTLLMTVTANQSRPDVGNYLKDNGLHGFSVPTPTALKSGNHVLSVRYESSSMSLGTSPRALTCATPTPTPTPQPAYQGYHDFVDCNNIGGWVRDKNNPGSRLAVSVFDDATGALIASGTANQFRQDLVNAGIGDGKYGFTIPTPAGMRDGKQHSISVLVTSSAFRLTGSPRAFNSATSCPAPTPTPTPTPVTPVYAGYIDVADCNSITGWAADRNRLNNSINVSLYDGNTLLTTVTANQSRPDVGAYLKDNGLHGFNIPVPAVLKSGTHTISVRYESSSVNLGNSPRTYACVTPTPTPTPAPSYDGYHDWVNCDYVAGWVRDKSNPNIRLDVSVYDDATGALIASGTANQFRQDLVNAGIGDGKYGFLIPTPSVLKDGRQHTVRVKVAGTNFSLTGTPKVFNSAGSCAPPASPDLVISGVSAASNVTPGGQLNVSATVLNQGGVATGGFRLGLYFSPDTNINTSDSFLGYCNLGGLSAGGSFTCNGAVTVPQVSGTYYVGAIADDLNAMAESNEGNNTGVSGAVTVGAAVPPTIAWEFNTAGNFEGWSVANASPSGSAVHDGILFLDPAGSDPYIISPPLSANASSYRTVVVKMASNGLDPFGNIYFTTQTENFYSADKRVEFTVQNCALCGSAPFITYTINMSVNSKWSGTITGIRIDPANNGKTGVNTDSMGFDFVRLTP